MEEQGLSAVRILVVDYDAWVRDLVRTMLRTAGYTVDLAGNGKEAMAALKQTAYDVVLTDLVMPEQEGIETIKAIRQQYPAAKVIAMSGAFGGDYLRIAGYLGAHGTLAKPIELARLLKVVSDALGNAGA